MILPISKHDRPGILFAVVICTALTGLAVSASADSQTAREHNASTQQGQMRLDTSSQARDKRFAQGINLAKQGKADAAIKVFGQLAQAYPKLPGPANNLAVLYAQQGQYDKARRWLEAALSTSQPYNIAYKNLENVYTALAAKAYSKALNQTDQPPDLNVNLQLVSRIYKTPRTVVTDNSGPTASTPQTEQSATTGTSGASATPAPEKDQGIHVVKAPEPTPEPAQPPHKEGSQTQSATESAHTASFNARVVESAVRAWAAAWSSQNVSGYLNAYAASFRPANGLSHAHWRKQRQARVSAPKYIRIEIHKLRIESIGNDRASAHFIQDYGSDTYSDRVQKTLILEHEDDGAWLIVKETSESL